MSAVDEGAPDASTPLLPKSHHDKRPGVSVIRVRIVSMVAPVFAMSALSARDSLISQYLVDRLAEEAGHGNHTKFSACYPNKSDPRLQLSNRFQSQSAEMMMNYNFLQSIPAFFACLLFGSYTDYLGRRLLLLLPLFTNVVKMVLISMVIRFNLDLNYMYLACGIDGLMGSWFVVLIALYALTVDISISSVERTFWIYFIQCASSTMEAMVNIAVGYLIRYTGFFQASLLLCSMNTVAFVVPLLFLPETLQSRPQQMVLNPLVHMRRIFGFYVFDGSVRRRVTFCLALTLFFVGVASSMCLSTLDALYQMHEPFCWNSTKIGYYAALRTAGANFLGALWLKLFQRCMENENIGMMGALFAGAAFTYEAFIQRSWQFFLVPIIGVPGTTVIPVIRSISSLLAGKDHQGALFSSIALVESLCSVVSTMMWNKIYAATVSFMPGAVYLVMALFSILTFILFVVYRRVHEHPQNQEELIVHIDQTDIN